MMPPIVLSFSSSDLKELCLRYCTTPFVFLGRRLRDRVVASNFIAYYTFLCHVSTNRERSQRGRGSMGHNARLVERRASSEAP